MNDNGMLLKIYFGFQFMWQSCLDDFLRVKILSLGFIKGSIHK